MTVAAPADTPALSPALPDTKKNKTKKKQDDIICLKCSKNSEEYFGNVIKIIERE